MEALIRSDDESDAEWEQSIRKEKAIPELETKELRETFVRVTIEDIFEILTGACRTGSDFTLHCRYFANLQEALLTVIDEQALEIKNKIAQTAVTKAVYDAMDYAQSESVLVRVEGDPRFGKSESIKAWTDAHPGLTRLVTVPCSNKDNDLYRAIAEALGFTGSILWDSGIKERVEFVLKNSRLMLVFDEAHFAIPQRYSSSTPPMRLNWIRTQIVDRKLPCVLIITPQSFEGAMSAFLKKTQHRFDQFFGRIAATFQLPSELEFEDLVAVAEIHFPEIDKDYRELIATKAMQSESYLQAMEHIAKRARYLARKNGEAEINEGHIEQAFRDILPGTGAPSMQTPCARVAKANPARKETQARRATEEPNRISRTGQRGSLAALQPSVIAA